MKSIEDIIKHYKKEDKPMQAIFNQVSDCCHYEIGQASRVEFPLGGSTFGITYTEPVCTCCGKDCASVDQCEACGVVGCLGDCDDLKSCPQCEEQVNELFSFTQFLTERATVVIQVCPACYDRISNS